MADFAGTNVDEIITPYFVSSTVTATGGTRPSNAADFIDGGAGNDTINGGGGADLLIGGEGNDVVTGGAGNDTAFLGNGDDRFIWNAGDGSDVVEGEAGADTLEFNGSNAKETITIAANGQRVLLTDDVGNVTMDINGVENIVINAKGGDDVIVAGNGLAALTNLTIDGGSGNDTITGGDGNDTLIGGDGNDIVTGGRGSDVALLGNGNDLFVWNPGDGSDVVEGGAGTDTLQFNGSNVGEHIDISANGERARLFRDVGAVTMDLNSVEKIQLAALGGADVITVNDLTGTGVKQVAINLAATGGVGDGQADTVIVNGTAGNDHVNIFSSGTSVVVKGLAAQVTVDGAEAANDVLAINGLAGDDTINASGLNAGQIKLVISGGDGNDTIQASNGGDTLLGGAGNDKLSGGTGDDHFSGNDGDDIIVGGGGNDVIDGGAVNDVIRTGAGIDFLQGGSGNDTIDSGGGNDTIDAGSGDDVVTGGAGNDVAFLGDGNDLFVWNPGYGSDVVEGDAGIDTLQFNGSDDNEVITISPNGSRVSLARDVGAVTMDINGVENIVIDANGGDDVIVAGNGLSALTSLTIDGGAGNDTITGGDGNDTLLGGDGDDVITGGRGNDVAFLGAGDDRFVWNPGDGSDTVEGQGGFDTLVFNGSNVGEHIDISANGTRTTLHRDVGNVTMDLNGVERIELAAVGGPDTITVNDLSGTGVKQVAINLAATGGAGDGQADTVILNGSAGNNHVTIAGNGSSIAISGLPVQVTIDGAEAGTDSLVISTLDGNDTIDASTLNVGVNLTIDGGAGNDTIIGSRGADVLIGGDGNDTVTGGVGNDLALLGNGDDRFIWNPGDGSDVVEGRAGFDTLVFNGANVNETMDISANGSRALLTRDVGAVTMDLNGVERIELAASGGADTIVVNDLTGTDVTQVAIDLAAAGTNSGDGQADQVIVNGTANNDVITIDRSGGVITVSGLAETVTIAHAEGALDQLTVSAGAGDDVIDASNLSAGRIGLVLNGGAGNDVILGSHGNDTVIGGTGSDVASLGDGNDVFIWNPGDGSDTVDGGSGFDTLAFNGSNVGEHIDISANGTQATLFRDVGNVTMHLASIERIDLSALGGADNITVNDLTGTGVKQVAIDLAATGGVGDGQTDTVAVNGTAGNDYIDVTASGSVVTVDGLRAQVTVDHGEAGDLLAINGGAGNDTIDASAMPAGTMALTLNGGDGNDTIKGGAGNEALLGGSGNDTFVFNFGQSANDVVLDFTAHNGGTHQADTIVLAGFSDHTFDQAIADGHIAQSGADVVISDGTSTVATLQNVSLSLLHANDFLFA